MTANRAMLIGITTITPNHCGTGQASGAVDLPIAREVHTGLPVMPASTIKGVMRDGFAVPDDPKSWTKEQRKTAEEVKDLFGPRPPRRASNGTESAGNQKQRGESQEPLSAGDLVFLEGMLLAFPVRSLTGVFRWVTSPMLVKRLRRMMRALGRELPVSFVCPEPKSSERALLPSGQTGPVSLEDLVFSEQRCDENPGVGTLAKIFSKLAPDVEGLDSKLVVVTDEVLQDLTQRGTTVSARIVLNHDSKTSDNLWYEETLPPDCLFATVVAPRPGAGADTLAKFNKALREAKIVSDGRWYTFMGGNATVGQGLVALTLDPDLEDKQNAGEAES